MGKTSAVGRGARSLLRQIAVQRLGWAASVDGRRALEDKQISLDGGLQLFIVADGPVESAAARAEASTSRSDQFAVVTDFHDWKLIYREETVAELRLRAADWEATSEEARRLIAVLDKESLASGSALDTVKQLYADQIDARLLRSWLGRVQDARVLLAAYISDQPASIGTATLPHEELAAQVDEIVWQVIDRVLIARIAEHFEGTGDRDAISRIVGRLLLENESTLACQDTGWQAFIAAYGSIDLKGLNDQVFKRVAEPFVRAAAGSVLARHLGYVYELALSERVRLGSDGRAVLAKDTQKRRKGVYYTPSDAAQFVCDETLSPQLAILDQQREMALSRHAHDTLGQLLDITDQTKKVTALDPACGAGSFLVLALRSFRELYQRLHEDIGACASLVAQSAPAGATKRRLVQALAELRRPGLSALEWNIYGIDVDPRAAQYCAVNLAAQVAHEVVPRPGAFVDLLSALRQNIVVGDALIATTRLLDARGTRQTAPRLTRAADARVRKRAATFRRAASEPPAIASRSQERAPRARTQLDLSHHFPEVFAHEDPGFSVVLGNPPYAPWRDLYDDHRMLQRLRTAASNDLYALFVEAALLLRRQRSGRIGLLVPLSITFSRHQRAVRQVLLDSQLEIYLSHYDNMPDTIFRAGKPENTNTNSANSQRVTIVLAGPGRDRTCLFTTDLQRWAASERIHLFANTHYSNITAVSNADAGFPRIGNNQMLRAYLTFMRSGSPMSELIKQAGPYPLFVPSTGRYFIPALPRYQDRMGEMVLSFESEQARVCAAAIINSNVFYWYWRALGDGFHITQGVIGSFPVPAALMSERIDATERLVKRLWSAQEECEVEKANAGYAVRNVNFNIRMDLLHELDELLIDAAGLSGVTASDFSSYKRSSTLWLSVDHQAGVAAQSSNGRTLAEMAARIAG